MHLHIHHIYIWEKNGGCLVHCIHTPAIIKSWVSCAPTFTLVSMRLEMIKLYCKSVVDDDDEDDENLMMMMMMMRMAMYVGNHFLEGTLRKCFTNIF